MNLTSQFTDRLHGANESVQLRLTRRVPTGFRVTYVISDLDQPKSDTRVPRMKEVIINVIMSLLE